MTKRKGDGGARPPAGPRTQAPKTVRASAESKAKSSTPAKKKPAARAKTKWAPTHTVLEGGLQAYVGGAAAARLDPGLEVQLVEWSGEWARVVASNGWESWVDGRALRPMAAVSPAGPSAPGTPGTPDAQQPPAQGTPGQPGQGGGGAQTPGGQQPPPEPPPAQPPSTQVPPEQPGPERRGIPTTWIIIGILILLLIIGGAGGGFLLLNAQAADVTLEQANNQSANPFQPQIAPGPESPSPSPSAAPAETPKPPPTGPNGVAIYGGSGNNHVCDKQKLIDFLTTRSAEGAAWAGVEGISTSQIAVYIGQLTPEILSVDVRVTNHGFANGRATAYQSVFQAGTAVLVNQYGYPVVRCVCGNPITPPITNKNYRYVGPRWPGFNQTTIIIIVAPPGNVPNVPVAGGGRQTTTTRRRFSNLAGNYSLQFQGGNPVGTGFTCSKSGGTIVVAVKVDDDTGTISVVSVSGAVATNAKISDLNKLLGGMFKTSEGKFRISLEEPATASGGGGISLFEGTFDDSGGVTGHWLFKVSIFNEAPSGCDIPFTGRKS